MARKTPAVTEVLDAGTVRAPGTTTLSFSPGDFTSGLLVLEVADRVAPATVDLVFRQGGTFPAGTRVAAYVPEDGAVGAQAANVILTRRLALRGDVMEIDVVVAGGGGTARTRVAIVKKRGGTP